MKLGEMHTNRRGFTLIEILIVVIILGILAAIVIPQFSSATTSSKISGVQTTAQTLRGAVQLYYYQHNDKLPDPGSALGFWGQMTMQTDATGAAYTTASSSGPFGPYMQSIPLNALNNGSTVIDANIAPGGSTTTVCGWEYDYNSGAGNGMIHGTNYDGKAVVP